MDLRWPLRIVEERRDGVLVLALAGRLGAASAASVAAAVARAVGHGHPRLVIDLEGVDYASSAGLHALTTAVEACARADGALALCGLADPVRIALDLGGVLHDLPIEPTRDRAIVRVATTPPPFGTDSN